MSNEPRLIEVPINEIELLENNPRSITKKQLTALAKDLQRDPNFLKQRPPLLNFLTKEKRKVCYAGNQRVLAATQLGLKTIWCWIEDDVKPKVQDERMMKDNLHRGEWDFDKLKLFETSLLNGVGFSDDFLSHLFKEELSVEDDNFDVDKAVEEIKTPKTKTGDIYILGEHRLICGNSEDEETIKKLFDEGECAKMIYCDPPYNIGLSYDKGIKGNSTKKTYTNAHFDDNKTPEDYINWLVLTIKNAKSVTDGNAHVFYWCDPKFIYQVQEAFIKADVKNKNVCFWLKNQFNPVQQIAFNRIMEPCVYGTIGKPYLFSEIKNLSEILNVEVTGKNVTEYFQSMIDVWFSPRVRTNDYVHPTQKPITLHDKPIRRCTVPGDIIVDLFGGSGSTLIASEQMKRSARLCEMDPIFCDVIVNRWETFTGKKAILQSK
jgi:DNA modification methylase